jgi:hypothetical protein
MSKTSHLGRYSSERLRALIDGADLIAEAAAALEPPGQPMTGHRVVGIDPSLTCTGIAISDRTLGFRTVQSKPSGPDLNARAIRIAGAGPRHHQCHDARRSTDLVVIESPSMGASRGTSAPRPTIDPACGGRWSSSPWATTCRYQSWKSPPRAAPSTPPARATPPRGPSSTLSPRRYPEVPRAGTTTSPTRSSSPPSAAA